MSDAAKKFINKKNRLWINGGWIDSESGNFIDLVNPATGEEGLMNYLQTKAVVASLD